MVGTSEGGGQRSDQGMGPQKEAVLEEGKNDVTEKGGLAERLCKG